MAKKQTLKEKDERIVELNAKIKELTAELKEAQSQSATNPINIEELPLEAINVRFCNEENLFVLDRIAYDADGIATLRSSDPVAGRGFGEKKEHAFRKINEVLIEEVRGRLTEEENKARNEGRL